MNRPADLTRAANMAARVLLRGDGRLPVEPLPFLKACRDTRVYSLAAAVDALGMPEERLSSLLRDADAITLRMTAGDSFYYIVLYRCDGHPARLRFTLAHELGHRLLGHTGVDPAEEREADCFASHLLCPEPVLRLFADDAAGAAERIAKACYVSYSCARVALHREPAALPPDRLSALTEHFAPALTALKLL